MPTDGGYVQVDKTEVCQNSWKEFRIEWSGSGSPSNFAWYISDDSQSDSGELYSTNKDILLGGDGAAEFMGEPIDEFCLLAGANDGSGTPSSQYGNLIEIVDCSEPYENPCPDGYYYNNADRKCYKDGGIGVD